MGEKQGNTAILSPYFTDNAKPEYPRRTVSRIFEEEVEKNAGRTAVICGDDRISYAELNEKANQLAHYLLSQEISPGTKIALFMAPSIEMMVALLGIVKAQCVYVPIYHETPKNRIQYYLEDAHIPLVITQSPLVSRLAEGAPICCYDEKKHLIAEFCAGNPIESGDCRDPLYVIYTSGSTGTPKGVVVPHQGIARLVRNTDYMDVRPRDCVAQTLNIAFDASGVEIWGAFLNGAACCIVPREILLQPEQLGELLRRHQVTIMFTTTALFHELAVTSPETLSSLEFLYIGGEAMSGPAVKKFLDYHQGRPRPRVFNAYGPTECSVIATCFEVEDGVDFTSSIPIGKAISNTDCYVLDERLAPCAVDVPGELYLGGDGLALGYLGRPELTAEKFVANPVDGGKTKLYRTGDLVKYSADGNILYLDRIDNQVKIRGFRIELGEIETCLVRHPDVSQAVVLAKGADKGLCAYLVPHEGRKVTVAGLRAFLREEVPSYMIPAAFAVLPKFPLTANGKVDKTALGEVPLLYVQREYAEPAGGEEREIARIWGEILPLTGPFGREDNFFEVGGNSLNALRLAAKIKAAFSRHIELKAIFTHPVLKDMAAEVRSGDSPALTPIVKSDRERDIPLSYPQEMVWLHQQIAPDAPIYNEILTLTIEERLDEGAFERSLQEIVRRHHILRVRIGIQDGKPLQSVMPYEPFSLPCVDFCHLEESARLREAEILVKSEAKKPFAFASAPLVRFILVRLRPDCYKLYAIFHHLLLDGISMGSIFPTELHQYYTRFTTGEGELPPEPRLQYTDFALWQRHHLNAEVLARHAEYWRPKLAGLSALRLPVSRGALSGVPLVGRRKQLELSRTLTDLVKEFSREQGVTLFMTLLAAFKALLYRYSGQKDLAVWSIASMRDREEWQSILGNFLNPLVLRTSFSGEPNFRDFLQMVRDTCLDAYEHQEMPLQKLSALLHRNREHPAQILFVLQPGSAPLPGHWRLSESELPLDTAKFQLVFSLEERGKVIGGFMEYDTSAIDAGIIGRLCENFPALLADMIGDSRREIGSVPLIAEEETREPQDYFDISFNQRRLWLFHQLDPKSSAYHLSFALTLPPPADTAAIRRACAKLADRHESLRTGFRTVDGKPVQFISRAEIDLGCEDLSACNPSEKTEIFRRATAAPFDLSAPPLLRMVLFRLDRNQCELLVTMHHIISDGWSLAILAREFGQLYQAECSGKPAQLPSLLSQYRDFAISHNLQLRDPALKEKSHRFWRQKIEGGISPLDLPRDFQNAGNDRSGAIYLAPFDRQLKANLKKLAAANNTTLFMVLLAGFYYLLHSLTRQREIACGIPHAGRNHLRWQGVVGFFINTVIVKKEIDPCRRFVDFLRDVHEDTTQCFEHQDYPLELVLDDLKMKFPEISVFFNMHNFAGEEPAPVSSRLQAENAQDVKFDFTLYLVESSRDMELHCHYRKALFKPDTIAAIVEKYRRILEFFSRSPQCTLKEYRGAAGVRSFARASRMEGR